MNTDSVTFIFFNSVLANNFVLAMFLGLCPFLGVSGKLNTAVPMGLATSFVMLVSSICAYFINELLVAFNIEYLRLISYIVVIASAVQLVEMTMKKLSPALFRALGIYLPLITTNCAVLGVALFQTSKEYDFMQSVSYAGGAGVGFILALVLMAGLRERLDLARLPSVTQGAALSLILGALLSMAFMGFAGLGAE
ncbi:MULTISPECIES: RnfABCDGE type electron transport complex subunit A [Thiothrix]|jgi:electron transport complex protein RnfA|uniref:Ion-translocating oxidoreductase complex subunit A n=1 Tax=Thiothrix lacustris TaxID=525917 RepID=A0A1Y1QV99_9GAMM|nr:MULTISPECIES: RnfABCDGE type electron transport complex subunit A [Thiothrix]MDX9989996.1 RnfABCDGE type electron transport complex subunit A [Thiothrix unzii]OQX14699.1 MAG: electron transport complex subunit A [Thiothrix lacustris]